MINSFKQINIKVIPYKEQRYPTLGDYWLDGDNIEARISQDDSKGEPLDQRFIAGILLHEMTELFIVLHRGIKIEDIDRYDMVYKGSEPGNNPQAPYHSAHIVALETEELFYSEVEYEGT
jgi:hypothetical protein